MKCFLPIGLLLMSLSALGQEGTPDASVETTIQPDGTGTIVIEAHGELPKIPALYRVSVEITAKITAKHIDYTAVTTVDVIQ